MIGLLQKFRISCHYWHYVLIACALATRPLAAQETPNSSPATPYISQPRPATELLGRSLGLTAAVLTIGAVVLIFSRKYASNLLSNSMLNEKLIVDERPRITGRVRLTPRQTVHVLAIGQRVLVLGTGPQGAPELLTEWTTESDDAQPIAESDLEEQDQPQALQMPARSAESAA